VSEHILSGSRKKFLADKGIQGASSFEGGDAEEATYKVVHHWENSLKIRKMAVIKFYGERDNAEQFIYWNLIRFVGR